MQKIPAPPATAALQTQLADLLQRADLPLSHGQQQQLLSYLALLERWNQAYNLTAVRRADEMLTRHLLDSLVIKPWLSGGRFIDVGTGAGLPGVPLAIALPDCQFTLLDSLGKRIRFLRQLKHQLALDNVQIVQSRVESFTPPAPFDGVISRAFASLGDMLRWCAHLTDSKGRFYALKGQFPQEELQQLPAEFQLTEQIQLQVPGLNAERHLLIFQSIH